MKTSVLLHVSKINTFVLIVGLFMSASATAQTYNSIANGAWNSASTWQGGNIPPTGNIPVTAVINIKHIVNYVGANIANYGTINVNSNGGLSPRLIIPTGVNIINKALGKILVTNGELRQYRFAGGGETGTGQNGTFSNDATGYVRFTNSFVELAKDWSNQGTAIFQNSSLAIGGQFTEFNAIDSFSYSSISLGIQGAGDFTVDGDLAIAYFNKLRVEVASTSGKFELKKGTINGNIDYIALKNHVTGAKSNDKITASGNIITLGIALGAYCMGDPTKYAPNGKFTGTQTQNCSLNYFPAALMASPNTSSMNLTIDPVLMSGTDKQVGAKYKYEGIYPGVDAIVSIDSIIGGATLVTIDNNIAGQGFSEGFQPQIIPGQSVGQSYVVLSFNYKVTGTSVDQNIDTFNITALDIDGTSGLKEFDQISLGAGATAAYATGTPTITLTQPTTGTFKAINNNGTSMSGVDTSARNYMFTVSNANISSFKLKLGANVTTVTNETRLYSIYLKGFVYQSLSSLPVNLISFTAKYNAPTVTLNWNTASETGFSHFVVERSTDGINFTNSGVVFANGNAGNDIAKYAFKDNVSSLKSSSVYYRLKMVDVSGTFKYSDIVMIRLAQTSAVAITTFPNPTTNEIRVTVPESWQNNKLQYAIFNMNGQQVKTTATNGEATETIKVSDLSEGTYVIRVSNGTETATQRFIKVK